MKKILTISNLLKTLLLLLYFTLATKCLYMLLLVNDQTIIEVAFQNKEAPSHYATFMALSGIFLVLFQLIIIFLITKHLLPVSLFHFALLYFAFIPMLDISKFFRLFDGHPLFIIKFDLQNNLRSISLIPFELILLLVLFLVILRQNKYTISKWQITLLLIALFICAGILFLPELSEIGMFVVIFIITYMVFIYYEQLFHIYSQIREKIFFYILLALFAGKGLYRLLSIIYVYSKF